MTPEQREELKQAAQKLNEWGWTSSEQTVWGDDGDGVCACYHNIGHMPLAIDASDRADFIAAANPTAILSLIAQVEVLTVPQVGVSVERGGVYIIKGVQSFRLAYEGETRGEQEWYAGVLRKALAAPTIPAIPGTKEGA